MSEVEVEVKNKEVEVKKQTAKVVVALIIWLVLVIAAIKLMHPFMSFGGYVYSILLGVEIQKFIDMRYNS